MSMKMEVNASHIESVDVDSSVKETGSVSEITCDSGLGSVCLDSVALTTSLESTVSPKKHSENDLPEETASASKDHEFLAFESSTSISPDINDATENLLSLDEFTLSKTEAKLSENDHVSTTEMDLDELLAEIPVSNSGVSTNSSITDSTNDLQSNDLDLGDLKIVCDYKTQSDLEINNQMFRTSTVSLNEQKTLNNKNSSISKSPYSRSAENISIIDQNVDSSLNSSTKDLNTEKILSEFSSQKSKVSATHKLTTEIPQEQKTIETHPNLDVRYTRLPKELLPQDLGSIVKNVHGIFSSVSGSLKYAYNHTHRATVPKPKIIKTINGKVMDDIFEDNQQLTTTPENDKPITTTEVTENISDSECKEVDSDARRDIQRLQIESLERVLAEQRKENASMRERVKQQVDEMQEKDQTFKELEAKVDQMSKRVEQAEREKDAAVMRYASVECAAIEAKRAAEKAAVAERAAVAELELINNKLKSAHSEKQRICQLYDDKCHELQNNERSLAKAIEQQKELEGRLKWTQSKLRMEMDAYKESAERAEKLSQQISELEAAKEVAAANATDSVRAKQLEADLKESQAALILCRHEKEELERRLSTATQALDVCKWERDNATSALTLTTAEVSRLKESNERLEQEAAELAALRAQAALADTLSAQLQRESTRAAQAEEELSKERARAETCARREAAALEHAASLTASHVARRADDTERDAKTQALSVDNASLRERVAALEAELSQLKSTLADETERRHKENKVLARKVAELTEEAADANKKLEWEKGENLVLKKKHSSAIKELNRELQRTLKRCEQLEAKLPPPDAASTRTGSISSLSSGESAPQEDRLHNGHTHGDALPDIQVREPDRQALIERIVSLQRAAARRAERCEFLEEHSRQLTGELRAKCKLLRHLLCSLPAGAVASTDSDQHKPKRRLTKKEIARLGGGAMAAVWGGDPAGMTLELSLEMNKRLQAVLEDSLLKNITLKENMDTLGEEIARLKEKKEAPDTK